MVHASSSEFADPDVRKQRFLTSTGLCSIRGLREMRNKLGYHWQTLEAALKKAGRESLIPTSPEESWKVQRKGNVFIAFTPARENYEKIFE